jgi:RNA polymerase sigma-54 factor
MSLQLKLSQKMSQSLMMTPQLQHAIKLLGLSRIDYIEALYNEILENPVLEDNAEERFDGKESDSNANQKATVEIETESQEVSPQKDGAPVDLEDYLSNFSDYRDQEVQKGTYDDTERQPLEARLTKDESLQDYILKQINLSDYSNLQKQILQQILGNLNSQGYLDIEHSEIAQNCSCTESEVTELVSLIQTLEPVGVAARNLRECLKIQLEYAGFGENLASKIVTDHLEKLESRKYKEIAKLEKVAVDDVYEAIKLIQKLEPYPARQFIDETTRYITPDVYVYKHGEELVVSLNEDGLPKLKIGSYYSNLSQKGNVTHSKENEYINERVKAATWLIRSIHQRQQTILKVAQSIVKHQKDFFEHGIESLKPLVLKDVADDIEMHESTVSRVTSNKYMHTEHGIFEMKFFFRTGIKSKDGEELSSSSIKEKIKNIVSAEDPAKPISDQAIVEMLNTDGYDIARRTVAKYRENLGILSSSRRKKLF